MEIARRAGALVASVVAGKCPMCQLNVASTEVTVGKIVIKVCETCSQPLWNAMGVVSWVQSKLKKGRS